MHPGLQDRLTTVKVTPAYKQQELTKFKDYLKVQGNELSKMPDLLPYFALPVVKNPAQHPTFSVIFTQEWVLDIRQQLL